MTDLFDMSNDREELARHLEDNSLHHAHVRMEKLRNPSVAPGVYLYGETRYDSRSRPRSVQERWINPGMLSFSIEVQSSDGGLIIPVGDNFFANAYFKDIPVKNLEEAQSVVTVYNGRICGHRAMWVAGARCQMRLGKEHEELRQRLIDRSARNRLYMSICDAELNARDQFVRNQPRS